MATAEELLAGVSVVDKTLVISHDLRTINIPSSIRNMGVESDDDVLRLDFKMPRYIGDIDLSKFSIRINYINAKAESDIYTVNKPTIGTEYITFSWLVGPTATRYKGDTKFNVCLRILTGDGYVDREYNTTPATLPVLEGLEVEEGSIEQYSDLLAQWQAELFGIGDTEEASIKAISQAEQKAIENKGAEVLSTIPVDYQTAVSMTDNADRTKADAIICREQGEIITVTDSSDDYFRGLKIFGKTTQVKTTGKQLININQTTKTNNGITFTPNPDGSVHVKGTATANAYFIFDSNNPIPVKETELIASISGSDKVYMVVGYFMADQTVVNSIASVDDKTTQMFTYPTAAVTTRTFIGVDTGKTVDATVYPMVRLASNPDDSYESYSGGFASPSPEWPQPLNSVENPMVYVYGKNLLAANATRTGALANGVTFYSTEGSSEFVFNGTASGTNSSGLLVQRMTLPPGTYTCSVRGLSSGNGSADYINMKLYSGSKYIFTGLGNKTTRVFTLKEPTEVLVEVVVCDGSVYNNSIVSVQLEVGTTNTAHEKHAGAQKTAFTRTLHAIPVSSGGNYTDANGQRWICDEIDFERGVYIQRVKEITFNGTESWYISAAQYSSGTRFDVNIPGIPQSLVQDVLCDRFIFKGPNAGVETVWMLSDNAACRIITTKASTPEELSRFLMNNPTTVLYAINTPIETPLTAEEIQWFRFAHTNFPNTTVLNDAGATMELKYNADTKTWLENLPKATDEQVQTAVDTYLDGNPIEPPVDVVYLTDRATGSKYRLYVENGKLKMEVV